MKKRILVLFLILFTFTVFVSCGKTGGAETNKDTENNHQHTYGVDGKCSECEENVGVEVTKEYYYTENGYLGRFKVVNGKCYFTFTAECTSEMCFYIGFDYEESYYYDKDYEEKTEEPNYIKSIEVYEEGTTTNLVTAEKYNAEFVSDDGVYWSYSTGEGLFEREKTYNVVVNMADGYDKEYAVFEWDLPFKHRFYSIGVCEFCGYDCAVNGEGESGHYTYAPETSITFSHDYESVYILFDLKQGKYHFTINGNAVDKNEYNYFVTSKYENQTIYSQLPVEFNKSVNFTVTTEGKYCIQILVKSSELIIESVELTAVA